MITHGYQVSMSQRQLKLVRDALEAYNRKRFSPALDPTGSGRLFDLTGDLHEVLAVLNDIERGIEK